VSDGTFRFSANPKSQNHNIKETPHERENHRILACGGIDFSMPVVMTYAGDLNDGAVQRFLDDSTETIGCHADRIKRGQLGCVIGTHTGPGAIVIAFVPKKA
jgi:fatty acid-binding protein DegV